MQIETFENPEVADLSPEELAESQHLCEKLGLTGQLKLHENPAGPFSFSEFSPEQECVYRTCFPTHTELKEFGSEQIPLRVLQILEHAREHFDEIQVWSNSAEPDPIVVGIKQHPTSSWAKLRYPIARWGDALEPFSELKKKALQKLLGDVATAQSQLSSLRELLSSGNLPEGKTSVSPRFYS
jgi:hypothetical protein